MANALAWPSELRLSKDRATLSVTFGDGDPVDFPAEFLRVKSPSAEVRGHGPDDAITVAGKRHVKISGLEPVGNYAVRIVFDDGHATGIFSWSYFGELVRDRESLWSDYLAALAAEGKSRDP